MELISRRGHTLVIQVVIVLVIAGVVALPIFLITYAKTQQKNRLQEDILVLVSESNTLKEQVKDAYARIAKAHKRLPHAQTVLHEYKKEFARLFNRSHAARTGSSPPTLENLVALKRDFEDYHRRVQSHYRRIKTLLDLVDIAEIAVQRARAYQTFLQKVKGVLPYEKNRYILPQLEEATRQLGTKMSWVLNGINKYPEDLKGTDTPVLIKAGVKQIRDTTRNVDHLVSRIAGAEKVHVTIPGSGQISLAEYMKDFGIQSKKFPIPEFPEQPR